MLKNYLLPTQFTNSESVIKNDLIPSIINVVFNVSLALILYIFIRASGLV